LNKFTFILIVILFSKNSNAQNTFSECYDALHWHQTHDRSFNTSAQEDWENCIKGKEMPQLSLKTITGEKIETKNLKGKIIVINLWFTTCNPCIVELPALNKIVEEYKNKDAVFIGISTDTKKMLETDFFPKYKFDFKIVADGNDIVEKKLGHTGFPTTYIIDKNGKVAAVWSGGPSDKAGENEIYLKIKSIMDKLL